MATPEIFALGCRPRERRTGTKRRMDVNHRRTLSLIGDEIAHAWHGEIRACVKAVDEGRVSGIPYDQINKEIADRLGSP
jgi:hypothetical protein